jgi:hypothetical protein
MDNLQVTDNIFERIEMPCKIKSFLGILNYFQINGVLIFIRGILSALNAETNNMETNNNILTSDLNADYTSPRTLYMPTIINSQQRRTLSETRREIIMS